MLGPLPALHRLLVVGVVLVVGVCSGAWIAHFTPLEVAAPAGAPVGAAAGVLAGVRARARLHHPEPAAAPTYLSGAAGVTGGVSGAVDARKGPLCPTRLLLTDLRWQRGPASGRPGRGAPNGSPPRSRWLPGISRGGQAGRFGVHLLQMCAVMCASLILLGLLVAGASAVFGFADPRHSAPVLSAVVVTLTLSGSMVAWMRFLAMPWRPTLEMAGSTLLVGAVMVIGYGLDLVPAHELISGVCGLACVAMIAVMVPRFRLYGSPHAGHHRHVA